jgi:hypothetical protein
MPPWTDTSTKRKHPTTNFTYFAPLPSGNPVNLDEIFHFLGVNFERPKCPPTVINKKILKLICLKKLRAFMSFLNLSEGI